MTWIYALILHLEAYISGEFRECHTNNSDLSQTK
jgi:hypothetical protein